MYASIRQYRTNHVDEVARRAQEGFVPIVNDVPGFTAWYLVDSGDGTLFTVTVCEDRAGADASVNAAAEWVHDNLAELVDGPPTVSNGEVAAHA